MSKSASVLLAVIVGVLGGALVAGSALIGASAQPGSPTSTTNVSGLDRPASCGLRFKRLPEELRADLVAAHALPVGERRPAVRRIVKAARAGDYGKRVQRVIQHRAELRRFVRSKLPADLRADLRRARDLPTDERRAALKGIRTDALGGVYGERVQKFAEHRKEGRATCRANRQGQSST